MLLLYPNGDPNSTGYYIRPTPFVSISQNTNRNKMGRLTNNYAITLNGSLVTSRDGTFTQDISAPGRTITIVDELPTVITDQQRLKSNFIDGCYIEILDIEANNVIMSFYADVESINFEEGTYIGVAKYTINLTTDYIAYGAQTNNSNQSSYYHNIIPQKYNYEAIDDFNDTWSIETDEGNATSYAGILRSYRVTRNVSATGRKVYPHKKEAWQSAKDFVLHNVLNSGNFYTSLDSFLKNTTIIPSGLGFTGYNHIRSENIDKGAGSYSVNDTWILGSGTTLENFNISINSSNDSPYISVSIDGNIKGLSPIHASGYNQHPSNIPYNYALDKYNQISNYGQFGINSDIYKRANNSSPKTLHVQPASYSVGKNIITGEITYNAQFNNRPYNIIAGAISENITVNDTYPGDIFAVIPVLGRTTGPILQYIGGRTEYKRDVGIEFTIDEPNIPRGETRSSLLLQKPSLNESIKTDLLQLINELSPKNEPGIRKYFLSPPTENWNPKEGRYSLNLSWTYELDR